MRDILATYRDRTYIYQGKNPTLHARGVQIRSETDPIRSDSFGFRNQIFISDRINKVVS
jgi:hypothetical protein